MQKFGTYHGQLVYFVLIWYMLWEFGIFLGASPPPFGILYQGKSCNPVIINVCSISAENALL
jgi:hypothetical protein